jgi:thiamine-phosphate pyrophosphorylase
MRGLYAIVDMGTLSARRLDPVVFSEAVLCARPAALQLRAKDVPAREVLSLLRVLAPMCHRAKVPLVANDRPDLATLAGCPMVHVGQEDIGIDLVRRLSPGLSVGVSTHSRAQLEAALALSPKYVAFGPVYPTTSKPDAKPSVGITALREASLIAAQHGIPLVAIGGITLERVHEVAAAADCAAAIASLLPASAMGPMRVGDELFLSVAARARALHGAFGTVPTLSGAGAAGAGTEAVA